MFCIYAIAKVQVLLFSVIAVVVIVVLISRLLPWVFFYSSSVFFVQICLRSRLTHGALRVKNSYSINSFQIVSRFGLAVRR